MFLLFVLLLPLMRSTAQLLRRPLAGAYAGFSAYSLNHIDVFSFTTNQASLAQLKSSAAGIYGERRFLLPELNNYTAVVGLKTSSGNFGMKANYAGFTDYNEALIGLAYGRKLGSKLDVGAQLNYNSIHISNGYGNASAMSFEVGTVFHISEKLHSGIHINNPVGGKFGKDKQEKLSAVYSLGMGYDASEKLMISLAIEKEEEQPVNVNAGFHYQFRRQLLVRAGMATATSSGWFGIGLTVRYFRIDLTTSYHPQLGITPGLMLLFNFNNE